ncbi:uncharacterized protein K441DRAFT_557646, partial [Cenococcum geophilum 1.58]|uniref:uncharacterized protein n=1 Tax=Cenococcum geophilum 1.58 TaxID=794803 RepID=UPI00358FBECE
TICTNNPPTNGMALCVFSNSYQIGHANYDRNITLSCARRGIAAVPVFTKPHLFKISVKASKEMQDNGITILQG